MTEQWDTHMHPMQKHCTVTGTGVWDLCLTCMSRHSLNTILHALLDLCQDINVFIIKVSFFSPICVLCSDRAGSISTLDSLDFARYSDDGNRESDERVAGKMNHSIRSGSKRPYLPCRNKRWKSFYNIDNRGIGGCRERERENPDMCIKDWIIVIVPPQK